MHIKHHIKALSRDDTGAILILWAVSLAMVLGLVAWSFDLGRMASTQSELQSFADNVALAAAGELDGEDDAIIRANAAAANLISDTQAFGGGSQNLASGDFALDFYDTLPPSDTDSIAPGLTTNPNDAIYARVVVNPKTVAFGFGAAFSTLSGNGPSSGQVGAVAVAGFTKYACDITPMMFCIPSPSFDAADPATVGDMIRLRSGGQGAAWGPGNFGFLQPSTLAVDASGTCAGVTGAGPLMRCLLGAVGNITQCFPVTGVDTEPGQKVGITNAALNTRFDMWSGAMKSEMNNPDYAPAPNVIKGIEPNGGGCSWNNSQPTTDTAPIPRDDCFPGCAPYGDGNWSVGRTDPVTGYIEKNYGGVDPHPTANTRFEYYLAEIAAAGGPGSSTSILTGRSETGRPMCSANQDPDPLRRVIIAAAIDCAANPISGSTTGVRVHQFVTMFLTEPVVDNGGSPSSLDIYAEIIGRADGPGAGTGGTGGVFHDVVQLYR
jgi:Flp pilus assembly protein TadG